MPLHGTCFMGAGWSFIAIFAQQSPVAVFAAPIQAGAMNAAGGIARTAAPTRKARPVRTMSNRRRGKIRMAATLPKSLPPFKSLPGGRLARVVAQSQRNFGRPDEIIG
jgi:hypothetical protein